MQNIAFWWDTPTSMSLTQSTLTTLTEVTIIATCILLIIWLVRHW